MEAVMTPIDVPDQAVVSLFSAADAPNTLRIDSADATLLVWVRDPERLKLDGSLTANEVIATLFPSAQRVLLYTSPDPPQPLLDKSPIPPITANTKLSEITRLGGSKLIEIVGESRLPNCVRVELGGPIDISGIDPELRGRCFVTEISTQPIVHTKYETRITWKAVGEVERVSGEPLFPSLRPAYKSPISPSLHRVKY
jgi:hypothetical protein